MAISVPVRSVPDYYPSHKNPLGSGPVMACSDPFRKIRSKAVQAAAGRGSGRRAEARVASLERFLLIFQKDQSCRSRRDMKIALVIGFWEANGVEIWPFPFRSVPFRSVP